MLPKLPPEKERRLRELLGEMQSDLDQLLSGVASTDKDMQQRGVTYKAARTADPFDQFLDNQSQCWISAGGRPPCL